MARYRDSARAMPDALVVLSGDYRIDWWNPAAARLLGLRWPGDSHQRIANIYRHPDFVAFLSSRSPVTREVSLPSPLDSQVWLEIRLVPYGTDRYLLLARDVTHLHRLETMRRDFVGNVSHELRTPLTVIYGVAETLNEEMADDPEVGDMLRLLQEQSERMRRLVDDLLLLSRLETGATPSHPEWVDMPRLLEELVEDGKALSGSRHHRFELTCEPGLLLEGVRASCAAPSPTLFLMPLNTPRGRLYRRSVVCRQGGCPFICHRQWHWDTGSSYPKAHRAFLPGGQRPFQGQWRYRSGARHRQACAQSPPGAAYRAQSAGAGQHLHLYLSHRIAAPGRHPDGPASRKLGNRTKFMD